MRADFLAGDLVVLDHFEELRMDGERWLWWTRRSEGKRKYRRLVSGHVTSFPMYEEDFMLFTRSYLLLWYYLVYSYDRFMDENCNKHD